MKKRNLIMSNADLADILKLPAEQKLRLAELLWESLAGAPADVPLGEAHIALVAEERAAHRRNPDDVVSLEQALAGIRHQR